MLNQMRTLPYLDLSDPGFSTRGDEVAAARAQSWCARTPFGLAVLRYREVGMILRDRRFGQGSRKWPDTIGIKGTFADFWRNSVIGREGEAHCRLRAMAVPALSDDFVSSLKPEFDSIAENLCDALRKRDRCEFQTAFCEPFSGQAIATLLGMNREAWPEVAHDAAALGLAMGVDARKHEKRFNAACARLFRLADGLVEKVRQGSNRTSYVARLVAQHDRNADCTHEELLNTIVISIFGGVDTTRALLGLGLSLFIEHPDQWRLLRDDESLVPSAVEEIIRARPTTTWASREAMDDIEFNGEKIPRGTVLHLLVHASARDPQICEDSRFNIAIKRRRHFGFGGGAHHCIGHFVARTDTACALSALRRTFRTVSYDGTPEWLPDSGNTGALNLPIRYGVA